jgi:hypothetical protein
MLEPLARPSLTLLFLKGLQVQPARQVLQAQLALLVQPPPSLLVRLRLEPLGHRQASPTAAHHLLQPLTSRFRRVPWARLARLARPALLDHLALLPSMHHSQTLEQAAAQT